MIKAARMVMGAGVAWMLASTAQADVSLFASRVGAVDVAAYSGTQARASAMPIRLTVPLR